MRRLWKSLKWFPSRYDMWGNARSLRERYRLWYWWNWTPIDFRLDGYHSFVFEQKDEQVNL